MKKGKRIVFFLLLLGAIVFAAACSSTKDALSRANTPEREKRELKSLSALTSRRAEVLNTHLQWILLRRKKEEVLHGE